MKPATPACAPPRGSRSQAEGEQRIEIAHQQQRRGRSAAPQSRRESSAGDALPQRRLARALDGDTVGHRIGERHADLDHIGRRAIARRCVAKALALG